MLINLAYTAVLLGVLVFVHELGHFLVAKAAGVKVLKFSIGFGPKIFGFTRGETEYRLALLPLGGYVKMAGDLPHEQLAPEDATRGFLVQAPWIRAAIVAAGPVFNLAFPVLVYFFVYLGPHQAVSTRIGSVEPGLPAAEAKLLPGDRILAVDGKPIYTFDELRSALQPRYGKEIALTFDRDGKQLVTQITPAKMLETNPIETVPRGMIGISQLSKPPVVGVPAGSEAEKRGLATFDRILTLDGQPVRDEQALFEKVRQAGATVRLFVLRGEPIELPGLSARSPRIENIVVPRQSGEGYAALGVERGDLYVAAVVDGSPAAKAGIRPGDRLLSLNGKPLKSSLILGLALSELGERPFTLAWKSGGALHEQTLQQQKTEAKDDLGQSVSSLDVGLRSWSPSAAEAMEPEKILRTMGPGEAALASLKIVPEIIGQTAMVLGYLVTGRVSFKTMGGPIMLYQIAKKSAEQGIDTFLKSMAIISINLGLMNFLPVPILDGFHLVAAFWEGVRRRPIPTRAREVANWIGLAMLVLLMVMVFKNDITRLLDAAG